MRYLVIKNGNVIINNKISQCNILIEDANIVSTNFAGEIPEKCEVIDATGKYVSAGFIDMHVHGGGGYDFMDCTEEALTEIAHIHLKNGTTTMLPTAVSSSFEDTVKLIKTYKKVAGHCPNFYGIHLEGPYISKNQKGAHNEKFLHCPNSFETKTLIEEGNGVIKRITAAPELDNITEFAKAMIDIGVSMSIGHSDATSDVALKALKNGFSHITHLYSATPSVRKINQVIKAGVLEAAYLDDKTTVELIADGRHVAIDALRLAVKIKGADKVAFVSDALRPAGTIVSESYLGERLPENRIIIEDGVAKLPDRSSFAGSIATTSILLEKGINHYGMSIIDTVKMLSETPASILKIKNKGKIAAGYIADIIIFDNDYKICKVLINGEVIS